MLLCTNKNRAEKNEKNEKIVELGLFIRMITSSDIQSLDLAVDTNDLAHTGYVPLFNALSLRWLPGLDLIGGELRRQPIIIHHNSS